MIVFEVPSVICMMVGVCCAVVRITSTPPSETGPFFAVVSVTLEFEDFDGAYSAFGQNLMMSVLFIGMLHSRGSLRGQSLSIALTKMGGTAIASVAFLFFSVVYERSVLLPFLYFSILLFDILYVAMVYYAARHAAASPQLWLTG